MIGCIAKATSDTLHMDESEMDDVRWCTREQLKKAVEDSKRMDTPYQGNTPSNLAVDSHSCHLPLMSIKFAALIAYILANSLEYSLAFSDRSTWVWLDLRQPGQASCCQDGLFC